MDSCKLRNIFKYIKSYLTYLIELKKKEIIDKETFYNSKFNLVDYYTLGEKKMHKVFMWRNNIKSICFKI